MAYEFRRVDIRIFDFHLTLDPLVAPNSLTSAVEFLGDPDKYKQQFGAKAVAAGAFRIRPLRNKSRTHHHFWKYYATAFGEFDPWQLLVPFVCEPTQYRLGVTDPGKGIRAFARPAVYLFPFGWSTVIEMSLHGKKMTAAELRDFMGSIRTQPDGPFLLDGKPVSLSGVLKKYGEELKKACFKKGAAAADLRRVDRHIVVSLSKFDGDVLYYKPWHDHDPPMPAADKAAIHEILRGEQVSPAWVVASETNPNAKGEFLVTRFADAGFAITYFDIGTLLFPQNRKGDKSNAVACLTTNVMSSMMMLQSLQSFHDFPGTKGADPRSLLAQVRNSARQRVTELPQRYKSAVLNTWCKFYAPVQKLISSDSDNQAKGGK